MLIENKGMLGFTHTFSANITLCPELDSELERLHLLLYKYAFFVFLCNLHCRVKVLSMRPG